MLWDLIFNLFRFILYVIASYTFFRGFFHGVCEKINHLRKDKVLLYPFDLKNSIFNYKFIISFISTSFFLSQQNYFYLRLYVIIFFLYFIHHKICTPDKNDVLENSNLHVGYGAAMWYYKNYLNLFLPDGFIERVKTFESLNKVHVQKKLFILVPKSCRTHPYLDDETDCIERCRELPEYKKTNSGVKNRVYNLTVYHIRTERIRLAVEYAQPLKGLISFKRKKLFDEDEMLHQCNLFVESLQKVLKDEHDSYKVCEIVVYNDDERKVSDVLIEQCRLGNSVNDV